MEVFRGSTEKLCLPHHNVGFTQTTLSAITITGFMEAASLKLID